MFLTSSCKSLMWMWKLAKSRTASPALLSRYVRTFSSRPLLAFSKLRTFCRSVARRSFKLFMVIFLLVETSVSLKLVTGALERKEVLETRTPEPPAPPCMLPILLPLLEKELDRVAGPEILMDPLLTVEPRKLLRLEEVMADRRGLRGCEHKLKT